MFEVINSSEGFEGLPVYPLGACLSLDVVSAADMVQILFAHARSTSVGVYWW